MSVLAVSDLLFSDILEQNILKPVWEKLRGHFFAVTVVSALSLMYLTYGNVNLHCLPDCKNATGVITFSNAQAGFVNSHCRNSIPFYYAHCGSFCIVMTVSILIASSYWLHIPEASGSFSTIGDVGKTIFSLDMTLQELKELSTKPVYSDSTENQRKLRGACMVLRKFRFERDVRELYKVRCVVLVALLGLSVAVCIYILSLYQVRESRPFSCLHINESMKCVTDIDIRVLFSLLIVFMFSLLAQIFAVSCGCLFALTQSSSPCSNSAASNQINMAQKTVTFMATFWRYSRPVRSGILYDFIKFVYSEEWYAGVRHWAEEVVLACDSQLELYSAMGYQVFDVLTAFVTRTDSQLRTSQHANLPCNDRAFLTEARNRLQTYLDAENVVEKVLRNLQTVKYRIEECKNFVVFAHEEEKWELMIAALNFCQEPKTKEEFAVQWLKDLNLDLDELSTSRSPEGSLLYYALSKKSQRFTGKLIAAKYLLYNTKNGSVKYVHFRGKSMTLKQFLEEKVDGDNELLEYADHPEKDQNFKPSLGQERLHDLAGKYINEPEDPLNRKYVANVLCKLKFSAWDDIAKRIARQSVNLKHFDVFTRLLNAYIVTEQDGPILQKLECGVTEIEDYPCIWQEVFPSSIVGGIFLWTATRHIMMCCSREMKDKSPGAFDQCNQCIRIKHCDRELLLKLAGIDS